MEKRRLGKTNIMCYPLGLGGIPIQKASLEESFVIINKALDLGVNFIDSAKGYTCSEKYIGYAVKNRRKDIYLATKSMARDYTKMADDIKTSLENFNTSYIDLYQLHNVKNMAELELILSSDGAYNALKEAKEQKKILYIGITSHSKDFLNSLLDSKYISLFDTIQFPYNFIEDDAIDLFKKAKKLNIGTIAMKPLGGGVIEKADIALKYLLNDNNLDVAIPGMGSINEVISNLQVTNSKLNESDFVYINKLKEELKGDFCHRCGYCLPCKVGIDIPTIFTLERYFTNYDLKEWAKTRYFNSKVLPSKCITCNQCVKRCPYYLDIPKKLEKIVKLFESDK